MLPSRRNFICMSLGAAGAIGSALVRAAAGQEVGASEDGLSVVRRSTRAFGTTVSITVAHRDRREAVDVIGAAFGELKVVESVMSVYEPTSEVSRLNRSGRLDGPHPYLVEILRHASQYSHLSGGAFDITVQPLWNLYAGAAEAGQLPSSSAVRTSRSLVDWRQVEVSAAEIRLGHQGAKITLNGIAQGFAADRVATRLRAGGVVSSLVDTGELCGMGVSGEGKAWSAGIQHPRREDAFSALAELGDRSLATSGDYETTFSADHAHNHLFDPRTGRSPLELASVSVAASSAMEADALSTAICVLGAKDGRHLIETVPGADMFVVTKSGHSLATGGFPFVRT